MTMAGLASRVQVMARFLSLCAFAFWQGGFVFYSGVVVPIGSDELGDTVQGFITRRVTHGLNLGGVCCLGLMLLDWCINLRNCRFSFVLLGLWVVMGVGQAVLIAAHPWMDQLLDPETISISDRKTFRLRHQIYLWTSTVMWATSLVWVWYLASGTTVGQEKEMPRT